MPTMQKWVLRACVCAVMLVLCPVQEGRSACNLKDKTKITVQLYEDNTTWTTAAKLTSPPIHLFTMDVIAGIEVKGPASKTVKARIWSSDDALNTETITLTETPVASGTYRNTGTDVWPHFYKSHDDTNKRLKIVDESGELHVVPIINEEEPKGDTCEQSVKVDAAEVAVVDGSLTIDGKAFYDDMGAVGASGDPSWISKEHYYLHVLSESNNVTDDNCVSIGKTSDFVYIAGEGLTTSPGVCGNFAAHPLGDYHSPTGPEFTPDDIGTEWAGGECEWVVFACCSQVRITNVTTPPATDNGVQWIKKMTKVHALLGYSKDAPGQGSDDKVAHDFVDYLHGTGGKAQKTVVDAWMQANKDHLATFATAIVMKDCIDDKLKTLDKFPTKDGTTYKYYWFVGTTVNSQDITLP